MGTLAFSNPTVRINDITFSIVPNSVKSSGGLGETKVRAASAGGNSITTVHTSDAETKIGKMMFDLFVTKQDEAQLSIIHNNIGNNTVSLVEVFSNGETASETLPNCSLINDPEKEKSADGKMSLEFEGDPTVIG